MHDYHIEREHDYYVTDEIFLIDYIVISEITTNHILLLLIIVIVIFVLQACDQWIF